MKTGVLSSYFAFGLGLAVSVFFCEFDELPLGELLAPGVATVTGADVAAGEGC